MKLSDEVVGSTASGVEIIVARQNHIPVVQRMLSAAFHRVAAIGYQQWWDPFPVELIESSVNCRETNLAVEAGTVIGTIALSWEDVMFWGVRPPDAGYVHRLCTDPDIAPRGLGAELISWADATAAARGRDFLRLDTAASNDRLRAYYESFGFCLQGEVDVDIGGVIGKTEVWRAALYERLTLEQS